MEAKKTHPALLEHKQLPERDTAWFDRRAGWYLKAILLMCLKGFRRRCRAYVQLP